MAPPEALAVRRFNNAVELDLRIAEHQAFFPDHFPRFSMLPGVAQIDWAIRLGREHLGITGSFRKLSGLKFQHPILPGASVTLCLARTASGELEFAYQNRDRDCSSGRVLFSEGTDGMPLPTGGEAA